MSKAVGLWPLAALLVLSVPLRPQTPGSSLATVAGRIVGKDGKSPVTGAVVQLSGRETILKYSTKTDKRGEFAIRGVRTGAYDVTITQGNEVIWRGRNFGVSLDPGSPCVSLQEERGSGGFSSGPAGGSGNVAVTTRLPDGRCHLDVNLAAEAKRGEATLSPEERRKREEQAKEAEKAHDLNAQFALAVAAEKAGDFDQAISILQITTVAAPTSEVPWANLAQAYLMARKFNDAIHPLKKAIAIRPDKANYHMALGDAYEGVGRLDDAVTEYGVAVQMDPTQAAAAHFKIGAGWTNAATRAPDDATRKKDIENANAAFDKAIATDPGFADAYYQKGINLVGQASYTKEGKIVPVTGTAEAFQKYLELAPTGGHAAEAKQLLAGLGEQVQTTFKKEKRKK